MARMHSRKHGKSGSKRPLKKIRSEWLEIEKEQLEQLILKLAREGHSNAKIGLILRDTYGIPDVREFGLRITKVVEKEIKRDIPEDMFNIMKKAVNLHKHLESNKKDAISIHALGLIESKVRRLGKYYVRQGRLPEDWKYTIEKAKLLVK
ncbi:MAG TPA: 30S ribosomal protein S15 [archaeon]|nr:30S ribosomal protein S15 [archaeon]